MHMCKEWIQGVVYGLRLCQKARHPGDRDSDNLHDFSQFVLLLRGCEYLKTGKIKNTLSKEGSKENTGTERVQYNCERAWKVYSIHVRCVLPTYVKNTEKTNSLQTSLGRSFSQFHLIMIFHFFFLLPNRYMVEKR